MKINLRRGDFEGMHPKAKLFGFDENKKLYTGDGAESINDQWTTWCACIAMLHLEVKELKTVPDGFVLVQKEPTRQIYRTFYDAFNSANAGNTAQCFKVAYKAMIEAQEQANV